MKIVVQDAPSLKAIMECITGLVEEAQFEVKVDGLSLKAMDPSQISMISFMMPKTAFVEYDAGEETKLGLDLTQFVNVLSRGKKGEKVEITTEDGRLILKIMGAKQKKVFKIPLIENRGQIQREPKIETGSYVKIKAETLKELLKDAKLISSHIRLRLNPEQFMVDVKGDNGEVHSEMEKDSEEISELKADKEVSSTFPLQYVEDMVKATTSGMLLTLFIETDRPLKLEYEMEGAKFTYYLAPRIEQD